MQEDSYLPQPGDNVFNPELFPFDPYQTHDLIALTPPSFLLYPFSRWITNKFPNNFPFTSPGVGTSFLSYYLFDRFTPDGYPWADEYSIKLYKKLFRYIPWTYKYNKWNGLQIYGIGMENYFTSVEEVNFGNRFEDIYKSVEVIQLPKEITIDVPENTNVSVTWLENVGNSDINFPEEVGIMWYAYQYVTKRHLTSKGKGKLTIPTQYMLVNSIVVSGNGSEGIKGQLKQQDIGNWLLYDDLDERLQELQDKIVKEMPRIFNVLSVIDINLEFRAFFSSHTEGSRAVASPQENFYFKYKTSVSFTTEDMRENDLQDNLSAFIPANNDKWNNNTVEGLKPLGKIPKWKIDEDPYYTYLEAPLFEYTGFSDVIDAPAGYEIFSDLPTNVMGTHLRHYKKNIIYEDNKDEYGIPHKELVDGKWDYEITPNNYEEDTPDKLVGFRTMQQPPQNKTPLLQLVADVDQEVHQSITGKLLRYGSIAEGINYNYSNEDFPTQTSNPKFHRAVVTITEDKDNGISIDNVEESIIDMGTFKVFSTEDGLSSTSDVNLDYSVNEPIRVELNFLPSDRNNST